MKKNVEKKPASNDNNAVQVVKGRSRLIASDRPCTGVYW